MKKQDQGCAKLCLEKQDRRRVLFYTVCGITLAVTVGLIGAFVYILTLRTQYRASAMEINEAILEAQAKEAEITIFRGKREEEGLPADDALVNYYDRFLLDAKTVVYSKKPGETDDRTITLLIGQDTLSFTGQEDGSAVLILWQTEEKTESYTVRAQITFQQLTAYYSNYKKRLAETL